MSDHISDFFAAWGEPDPDMREQAIRASLASDVSYLDPRTPEPITDIDALVDYVAMFSAQAPGAIAEAGSITTVGPYRRATVTFSMPGGMKQLGQYFIETDDKSRPVRMVGFVGLGEPE